MGLTAPPQH